jgi:dipeptidyl aminopeptidase/acylaminoacyl peptidase
MNFRAFVFSIFCFCLCLNVAPIAKAANGEEAGLAVFDSANHSPPVMSPDGKYLAYIVHDYQHYCKDPDGRYVELNDTGCLVETIQNEGYSFIEFFDLEAMRPGRRLRLPRTTQPLSVHWANSERVLIKLFRFPGLVDNGRKIILGGTRMISTSPTEEGYTALFQNQTEIAGGNWGLTTITNILPSDSEHIIMPARRNNDLDLWRVNIISGDAERIARGNTQTAAWHTDRQGRPVFRMDCHGKSCKKMSVHASQGYDQRRKRYDWKKIKTFKINPDEDEKNFDFLPIAATEDSKGFYVLANEEGDARRNVKIYNPITDSYTKTIYEHPKVDIEQALTSSDGDKFLAVGFYDEYLNYKFFDPEYEALYKSLRSQFALEENVELLDVDKAKSKAIIRVSSTNKSAEIYIFDKDKNAPRQLFASNRFPTFEHRSKTNILTIKMSDGQDITAYHTLPTSIGDKQAPLIVMPHGGPEVRNFPIYDPQVQYFASKGYQILQPNFRGSSGYGRDFARAGFREWGGVMQTDIYDSVNYLFSQGLASREKTCISGYSYGGYAALFAVIQRPNMFQCVASGGGPTDLRRMLRQVRKDFGSKSGVYEYWTESIGDEKADRDRLANVSPAFHAASIQTPIFLAHGSDDQIVDIEQSEKMSEALEKAGVDHEFLILDGARHSGWGLRTTAIYIRGLEAFFAEHIPPE